MSKEDYHKAIEENDSYPTHSHKFIAALYIGRNPATLLRNFGPFDTQTDALKFVREYKEKHTKKGFVTGSKILPLCEVLP